MNKIEDLLKDINDKLNELNKIKENIENYINEIKLIKENTLIYENDNNNNYKEYIIKYIEKIKNKLEFKEINLNNLLNKDNYIISIYEIKKDR